MEQLLAEGTADASIIAEASVNYGKVLHEIEEKTLRWMELSEKAG